MARCHFRQSLFCILVIILYLGVPLAVDAAVEDLLAELNAKSPEERLKVITENAKKEGEVTLYTAVNMRDAQELTPVSTSFIQAYGWAFRVSAGRACSTRC
jgi:hypothetical protein